MSKITIIIILILTITQISYSQDCDCQKNFEWVKKTFEENDAGFESVLKEKGIDAYEENNRKISGKVKTVKNLSECGQVLFEWLTFFRGGHIAIRLKDPVNAGSQTLNQDWESFDVSLDEFKKYLDQKDIPDQEGIWETGQYKIGIKKVNGEYIGFIVESGVPSWIKGQVKTRFSLNGNSADAVFYMRDRSAVKSDKVTLTGKNYLQIGNMSLVRIYPEVSDDLKFSRFTRTIGSKKPYAELLDGSTFYIRIPSFQPSEKKAIDSVIAANRDKILTTENLIIDIRNGTGGSDISYKELLPFLYTNPIREVGVQFYSTKLNNQRMLDFINKPEYGFDEESKVWAKKGYDTLEKHLGEFINLNEEVVSIIKYDTVYPYPRNIGIIINRQNGSTDEQFLLAAKQSKKVKLFGTTTTGVLDVSNMYFIPSPCNEFDLGYSLTRSMRIPDFTIDGKGIQPDYFLDKEIPQEDWTEHVSRILRD